MPTPTITCIVEGHGEVRAVPVLLRRLAGEIGQYVVVLPPIRCPKSKIVRGTDTVNEPELRRAIELAALKLPSRESGAVLILLDADDACPAHLGPRIQQSSENIRPDVHIGAVIAKREFEAWFLADPTLWASRPGDSHPISDPEAITDPKSRLRRELGTYRETIDQPRLAATFDLAAAEAKCDSFRKFRAEVTKLFQHVFPELS